MMGSKKLVQVRDELTQELEVRHACSVRRGPRTTLPGGAAPPRLRVHGRWPSGRCFQDGCLARRRTGLDMRHY